MERVLIECRRIGFQDVLKALVGNETSQLCKIEVQRNAIVHDR